MAKTKRPEPTRLTPSWRSRVDRETEIMVCSYGALMGYWNVTHEELEHHEWKVCFTPFETKGTGVYKMRFDYEGVMHIYDYAAKRWKKRDYVLRDTRTQLGFPPRAPAEWNPDSDSKKLVPREAPFYVWLERA